MGKLIVYNWSDGGTEYGAMLNWKDSGGYEYYANAAICSDNGNDDQTWIGEGSIVSGVEMDMVKAIINLSYQDWALADQKMSEHVQTKKVNHNGYISTSRRKPTESFY